MQPPVTRRGFLLLGGSLGLLCGISCGPRRRKLYPVRGKVLFEGQPAEGALVTLHALDASDPMEVAPRAYVQAGGSFAIGTYASGDGAPAGEYKVSVVWLPPDARERALSGSFPTKLPASYSDPKTSGLRGEVKEQPNEWPAFQLTARK
jgi:hypothetical protein